MSNQIGAKKRKQNKASDVRNHRAAKVPPQEVENHQISDISLPLIRKKSHPRRDP
jgi:hypothetical protein